MTEQEQLSLFSDEELEQTEYPSARDVYVAVMNCTEDKRCRILDKCPTCETLHQIKTAIGPDGTKAYIVSADDLAGIVPQTNKHIRKLLRKDEKTGRQVRARIEADKKRLRTDTEDMLFDMAEIQHLSAEKISHYMHMPMTKVKSFLASARRRKNLVRARGIRDIKHGFEGLPHE
jgi:hypothetical protein